MSWNISTRLNNLQQQVNNIANEGLTNPLEQVLNANSYALQNLSVLDGGANVLQLQSSNIGGITTNNNLTVSGDAFVNTLHYSALSPPITNGNTYILNGNATEPTGGNFVLMNTNPNVGFVSNNSNNAPFASGNFTLNALNNTLAFGFSTSNTLYPQANIQSYINYGIFYYPTENTMNVITNGNLGASYSYSGLSPSIIFKVVATTLKVFIDGLEVPVLEQQILNNNYYLACYGYANINASITANNVKFNSLNNTEGLADVLTVNNNANGLSMVGVGGINCTGNIFTNGYLEIGDLVSNSSQLHLFYGNGTSSGDNFQVIGSTGGNFIIQQYSNNSLINTPFQIINNTSTTLKTSNLIYTQDGTNNYYILDSNFNTPCYKQIFTNLNQTLTEKGALPSPIFSVPIYTKTPTYNYGVNYAEILFSALNLTFTSSTIFSNTLQATIFLSSTSNPLEFNPALGNSIVINVSNTNGVPTYTFNSSIPIILYYNNTTQFDKLYLLVAFNIITLTNYNIQITNSNMAITGYISSNPQGTITWGS